jgi:hypothetical protein
MSTEMVRAFEKAAGAGCAYELRLRLLADVIPALRESSMAYRLDDLEKPVVEYFKKQGTLSDGDAKALEACRRVRNKLLHGELDAARKRLIEEADAKIVSVSVMRIDLRTEDVRPVTREGTTPGNLFGWLMEAANSGDFDEAEKLFRKGEAIVVALAFAGNK